MEYEINPGFENTDIIQLEEAAIERKKPTGFTWFAGGLIVINAALGAALLQFPEAYHRAGGVVTALSIQAVMMLFVFPSLLLLGYCAEMQDSQNYQEVISTWCGFWGRLSCSLCITLYCFGTCITFLIIIGDQWDEVFKAVYPGTSKPWFVDRRLTISVTSVLFILPLCFSKRIDFLSKASAVGVIGILYMFGLITVKYFLSTSKGLHIKTKPTYWTDVFLVVPTIGFGYQCHLSAVPVYACLKKRSDVWKVVTMAMAVCILFYSTTAVFGYWTFGANIGPDIMTCYNASWDVTLAVAVLAIKTYTTYPILHFCGRVYP